MRYSITYLVAWLIVPCTVASAQFTTVINVPPEPAPTAIGSNTQLNLHEGGSITTTFHAGASDGSSTNVEMNIDGGSVTGRLQANAGSTINISAGEVISPLIPFGARSGSTVNISGGTVVRFIGVAGSEVNLSGGTIGRGFEAHNTGLTIYGADFRNDGVLIPGLESAGNSIPLQLFTGSLLTGTLADGTPFAFTSDDLDFSGGGPLTLVATRPPPIQPTVINVPNDPAPRGVRGGQSLYLSDGGALDDHFSAGWGSELVVTGGQVGHSVEAVGANVTINGGAVGHAFHAYRDTEVNISGGSVGQLLRAKFGSQVNISGGSVGRFLTVDSGGVVNISGGVGFDFLTTSPGSELNIFGGEFLLDGNLIPGLDDIGDSTAINLVPGSVLSGTFADGTAFALAGGEIASGTLQLFAETLPEIGPAVINVPSSSAPLGIRQGQSLTLNEGGMLGDNFTAGHGSTVFVNGGVVGENFNAASANITISGGSIGPLFGAFSGTVVDFSGGVIGGPTPNLFGFPVVDIRNDSIFNMTGGEIIGGVDVRSDGVMNISGGIIDEDFDASNGSTVNLFGTRFILNGVDITSTLTAKVPLVINDRDVKLSGLFIDGTPFDIDLTSTNSIGGRDYVDPAATLTITLVVPEPATSLLAFVSAFAAVLLFGHRPMGKPALR